MWEIFVFLISLSYSFVSDHITPSSFYHPFPVSLIFTELEIFMKKSHIADNFSKSHTQEKAHILAEFLHYQQVLKLPQFESSNIAHLSQIKNEATLEFKAKYDNLYFRISFMLFLENLILFSNFKKNVFKYSDGNQSSFSYLF